MKWEAVNAIGSWVSGFGTIGAIIVALITRSLDITQGILMIYTTRR